MIRKYQPKDREAILTVWENASAVGHSFLTAAFLQQERQNIAEIYLPNSETWVWESDGIIKGFISLHENEVGGLFVDPKHHRAGIGHALMDKARALHKELEVEVFTANMIGRAFYAKYGFKLMHHKIEEQTGFEVMRLRLTGKDPESSL